MPLGLRSSRPLALVPPCLISLVVIGAFLRLLLPAAGKTTIGIAALWGLMIVGSFAGWGALLNDALCSSRRADAGLWAVWGAAFTIVVGGVLCAAHLVSGLTLTVFVGLGLAILCVRGFRQRQNAVLVDIDVFLLRRPGLMLVLVVLLATLLLQYFHSIVDTTFNACDDFIAYFPFAREILDSGTLFDPFSQRRMLTLGGHAFLHALTLTFSTESELHLLDRGICPLLVMLLLLGHLRSHAGRSLLGAVLGMVVVLMLPDLRINTMSLMSGAVFFFGLYRTLCWIGHDTKRPVANATFLALLFSAACTLRQNYMVTAVAIYAVTYGSLLLRSSAAAKTNAIREAFYCALLTLLFLSPWLALSQWASGTFLWPIIQGNARPEVSHGVRRGDGWTTLHYFLANVKYHLPIYSVSLFTIAGMVHPDPTPRKPMKALLYAYLLTFGLLVWTLEVSDPPTLARYYSAPLIAAVLAVLLSITGHHRFWGTAGHRRGRFLYPYARVLAMVAAFVHIYASSSSALDATIAAVKSVGAHLREAAPFSRTPGPELRRYRALQTIIRPGVALLTMTDHAYNFDFNRNRILILDIPGVVAPAPGWPLFQGPEPVAGYLSSLSIRYVVFVRPTRSLCLYNRKDWLAHLKQTLPIYREEWATSVYHQQAPYFLDVFANFEALSQSRLHLFDDSELVLLDLETRVSASTAPTASNEKPLFLPEGGSGQ